MRNRLSLLLLAAALVSGNWVSAQSTLPGSTTLSVHGTIDKYDVSTRVLALSTSSGIVRFFVASTARLRQGLLTIDAPALKKLTGYRAIVRYAESGGNKTVESVHVFGN
jgi:hypothetical protein